MALWSTGRQTKCGSATRQRKRKPQSTMLRTFYFSAADGYGITLLRGARKRHRRGCRAKACAMAERTSPGPRGGRGGTGGTRAAAKGCGVDAGESGKMHAFDTTRKKRDVAAFSRLCRACKSDVFVPRHGARRSLRRDRRVPGAGLISVQSAFPRSPDWPRLIIPSNVLTSVLYTLALTRQKPLSRLRTATALSRGAWRTWRDSPRARPASLVREPCACTARRGQPRHVPAEHEPRRPRGRPGPRPGRGRAAVQAAHQPHSGQVCLRCARRPRWAAWSLGSRPVR